MKGNKEWAAAFAKAKKIVAEMTEVEEVCPFTMEPRTPVLCLRKG